LAVRRLAVRRLAPAFPGQLSVQRLAMQRLAVQRLAAVFPGQLSLQMLSFPFAKRLTPLSIQLSSERPTAAVPLI
jgi:hypothetical protein